MHLKTIHLSNHLNKIERDIEEMENLATSLKNDRSYASQLHRSLKEETQKLNELREKILAQVIKEPPKFLIEYISTTSSQKSRYNPEKDLLENRSKGNEYNTKDNMVWAQEPTVILPAKQKLSFESKTKSIKLPDSIVQTDTKKQKTKNENNSIVSHPLKNIDKETSKEEKKKTNFIGNSQSFPFVFKKG